VKKQGSREQGAGEKNHATRGGASTLVRIGAEGLLPLNFIYAL